MRSSQQIVSDFFAAWTGDRATMIQSFRDYLSPDCIWKNSGFPDAVGIDQILGLMEGFCDQLDIDVISVHIDRYVTSGNDVVTERRDVLHDPQGREISAMDVLGILRVDGDRIVSWNDYADPREVLEIAARKSAANGPE